MAGAGASVSFPSSLVRIEKASTAELNRWTDRLLTAESLADVLGTKARRRVQPTVPRAPH
jgi:hypothetical protein